MQYRKETKRIEMKGFFKEQRRYLRISGTHSGAVEEVQKRGRLQETSTVTAMKSSGTPENSMA